MPRTRKPKPTAARKTVNPAERKQFKAAMQLAYDGKLSWLHRLIERAGYVGDLSHLTARETARYFSVTPQAVGLWVSKMGCPRNDDGTYTFRAVLKWRIQHEAQRQMEKQITAAGGDPLLMGPSTDALEEYRKVQTEKVRFELDVKQEKFLPAEQVQGHWRELGNQIGATINFLDKKFPEAAQVLRDRVSAFAFSEPEPEANHGGTEDTEPKKKEKTKKQVGHDLQDLQDRKKKKSC